jgi:hypothetical protein
VLQNEEKMEKSLQIDKKNSESRKNTNDNETSLNNNKQRPSDVVTGAIHKKRGSIKTLKASNSLKSSDGGKCLTFLFSFVVLTSKNTF